MDINLSMLLPNRTQAYIPLPKLTEYLLSETHAVGKSKARFFRSFGFDEQNVAFLEQGLLEIAQTERIVNVIQSPFGTKYIIDGILETPSNVFVNVRTIWIIEIDDTKPRFVTAYPD
jgi:hypothetical protein